MKIALFCRYARGGASSRLRSLQFIPFLEDQGIEVDQYPLFGDDYIAVLYSKGKKPVWLVLKSYVRRVASLMRYRRYDLIWIEKELLPWLPAWFEYFLKKLHVPYIVDYDDAIFHTYDLHANKWMRRILGKKIDNIMRGASCVTVGNEYLAERAIRACARRVEVIPTVVDMNRYRVKTQAGKGGIFTVGWIGTPVTSVYLKMVCEPIKRLQSFEETRFVAVGSGRVSNMSPDIEVRNWSEESEIEEIQQFDVGIMPLPDEAWERGKCGYKIIQYMACGLPVVASPVGINRHLIEHGVTGFLAENIEDWGQMLGLLRDDEELRRDMGRRGLAKVESEYSLRSVAPRLYEILTSQVSD